MSRFELPLTTNEESLREKCFSVAAVIDRRRSAVSFPKFL